MLYLAERPGGSLRQILGVERCARPSNMKEIEGFVWYSEKVEISPNNNYMAGNQVRGPRKQPGPQAGWIWILRPGGGTRIRVFGTRLALIGLRQASDRPMIFSDPPPFGRKSNGREPFGARSERPNEPEVN